MASILNATTTGGLVTSADNSGSLQLQTNNGTTAVTIDTSQNVGVGTTSPTAPIDVVSNSSAIGLSVRGRSDNAGVIRWMSNDGSTVNGRIQVNSGGDMIFQNTNSITERMRVTSDGNVGIGTNNPSNHRLSVEQTATGGNAVRAVASNGSYSDIISEIQAARNTTNTSFRAVRYYNTGAGETKFEVLDSGTVNNRTGSYGTLSDAKLKENIIDSTPKLDNVMQLQVKNYNLIGSNLKQIGFVAQEFEKVFPSLVEETSDIDGEGNNLGTTTKTIKTTVLIPILVKAIQEQQAMIEELKQEVQLLKNPPVEGTE